MNVDVALKTFGLIFIAELGDKTQLVTLSLASSTNSRWSVFAGSVLALACTSLLAVAVGQGLGRIVPPGWLERFSGLLFIAVGAWFLFGRK